jgi:membrane protein EpsK
MISLANSLVMYASIVSSSLDVSIGRFLTIDLNRGDATGANRTFNTALALSVAAISLLLLPAGLCTYFFPALFNVPAGLEFATQFLFACVCFSTLAAILSGNFGVSTLITHRFDLRNVIRSLSLLGRIGIGALGLVLWPGNLWPIAVGILVGAGIGLAGDLWSWRRLTPILHVNRVAIDRSRANALFGLSGWSAINAIGALLLMQVDLLVVNAVFGAELTGRYASVLLFPALIYTLTEAVVAVLSPAITARYAVGEMEGVRRLATRSVKLLGLGLALPTGLLCGFSRPLLNLWLGPEFVGLDILVILLVGHLSVNLAVRPLLYILTAYNRVKVQGLVTLALGMVNVALAVVLARWSGWGMAGVAAASALVWTVKNLIFLSGYTAVQMGLPWSSFLAPLTGGGLGMLCITLGGTILSQIWWPGTWLALAALAASTAGLYGIVVYAVALDGADRNLLWRIVRRRSRE